MPDGRKLAPNSRKEVFDGKYESSYTDLITEYGNEKLLVNKQMVKTGIDEIPNLVGLIEAINKKESSAQYLADLKKIRKAYVQDVKENYSNDSIHNSSENINNEIVNNENIAPIKPPIAPIKESVSPAGVQGDLAPNKAWFYFL